MTGIYDPKNFDPSGHVGFLIGRVRLALLDALDKELAPLDITAAQYIVIASLANGTAGSPSEVCRVISYDPGAMTRMLDRLEAKDLVRRVRNGGDRRTVSLELTAEGKAIFPRMRASAVAVLNRLLKGFTRKEARELEGLLQRMLANK
jgi:DNA-binding MarR family transcriptional regulator